MPYTGRLENRPLLDVIQIVAYSQQSGILSVKGTTTKGLLIFEGGNIVCAYSPAALPLLVKAAKEADERHRLTFRRIQILAALRELFDVTEGDYRFVRKNEPVTELEGLSIKSFYVSGALDTGDLLLVLEKAMDEEMEVHPAPKPTESDLEHATQRQFERYGPVILKGRLRMRDRSSRDSSPTSAKGERSSTRSRSPRPARSRSSSSISPGSSVPAVSPAASPGSAPKGRMPSGAQDSRSASSRARAARESPATSFASRSSRRTSTSRPEL